MTPEARHSAIRLGALVLGIALFAGALYFIDLGSTLAILRRLGIALPVALLLSGLWHLVRTWAWAECFPQPRRVGFRRLARVRLAAEAFSYLTVRGVAGEPLKVVLLNGAVDARQATAAVAIERLAYLVGTAIIIGLGAIVALIGLPLTAGWFRVFRAFAIAAAVVTVLTIAVVLGRGAYFQSLLEGMDRALGTSFAQRRVARFIAAVERQMLDLLRGDRRRLLVLMTATAASYSLMALEGWVILRASGASIGASAALAVETFSRVSSFASAFIPANLGALEASSVGAVMAVGAVSGGAALAVARRLRGLFWAGVGLAIYPRSRRTSTEQDANVTNRGADPMLLYLPFDSSVSVPPSAKLAGLPIAERIVRAAARAGYSRIVLWAPGAAAHTPLIRRLCRVAGEQRITLDVATCAREWDLALGSTRDSDPVTVAGAGTVVSTALLAGARDVPAESGKSIDVAAGEQWAESGILRMTAGHARDYQRVARELARRRDRALPLPSGVDVANKLARLAIRIVSPADLAAAEQTIRRASYKDTDSLIARFNRRISLPISVALIQTPLTANQLSIILVSLGFYSAWLFSLGHYWTGVLAGLLSLAASVLDGCDGEIARLKYQESRLGCWIETLGDYSYYLAIFVGLAIGAVRQTQRDGYYWIGGVALAGTLLSFAILIFLRSGITAGTPEKLSAVMQARFLTNPTLLSRIIVRLSFAATRAGMPYGIMIFALAHALPGIVVLAAIGANVYWISVAAKMRYLLGRSAAVAAA